VEPLSPHPTPCRREQANSYILKMEETFSSETFVPISYIVQHYKPHVHNLAMHLVHILKYRGTCSVQGTLCGSPGVCINVVVPHLA
jgi:hypothetical protein